MPKLPFKTHRVRLRDDEIKLIAEALHVLLRKKDAEKTPWPEQRKVLDLAERFGDWGQTDGWRERPMFRRRRF